MGARARLALAGLAALALLGWCGPFGLAGTYALVLTGNDTTESAWETERGLLQGAFDRATDRIAEAFQGNLNVDGLLRLRADQITEAEFEARAREFVAAIGPADALLFYYAGHGFVGSIQPAFISDPEEPADAEEKTADPEAPPGLYAYERLWGLLESRACRTVVILDACHSGSAIGEFDGSWTVVASCRADQRTLLAGNFGSVFNVTFTQRITSGHTRIDEILDGVDLLYGEEYQVSGDVAVDLVSPCP